MFCKLCTTDPPAIFFRRSIEDIRKARAQKIAVCGSLYSSFILDRRCAISIKQKPATLHTIRHWGDESPILDTSLALSKSRSMS